MHARTHTHRVAVCDVLLSEASDKVTWKYSLLKIAFLFIQIPFLSLFYPGLIAIIYFFPTSS